MRTVGHLRVGRVVARGLGVWFRRFVPIHLVTAVCLAPLVLVPEQKDPMRNGTLPGVFGLYSAGWLVSMYALPFNDGFAQNAIVGYFAQFAVTVLLVREAHRQLAGRPARNRLRAMLGLLPFAVGSLAVFAALDLAVAAWSPRSHTPLPQLVAGVAITVVQTWLAATFWLAIPAAAVEGHGPLSALGRSRRLARGSRLAMAVTVVFLVVLEFGIFLGFAFAGRGRDTWAFLVPAALFVTLKACVLAAAYHELCLLREGPPPDEVGAVFA